ncbi:MAG TPA: NAD(P)/FAD-dependent oxidoreductase [Thermomicrobiales bacterium]|jgi:putative flavoprotein involved in K+ transport|nr:NAD(P)/FAD-dependent oxidoreductase [Thermomicrobiales bacterium]
MATNVLDVLVIGAGQAGLALGYQLKQTGQTFLLVDRYDRIGESWRRRFDSLTLFTPRSYSALPGLPVSGDPNGYPTKDEIAAYLETYARHFDLPVALGTGIARLEQTGDLFRATTNAGTVLTARSVVLATGAFQQPAIPALGSRFAPDVVQLTPETYRNPRQTPSGTVLVVGDGATGRQIARELSPTHRVFLSTGRSRKVSPHRVLGQSIFWWMDKLGILTKSPDSRIGRKLKEKDPFPGKDLALDKLQRGGVIVAGRLTDVDGRQVSFADGQSAGIDVVIWATGYRDESDWVAIPGVKDARGGFVHDQGLSAVPGLAFIGRSWQRSRGSALLTGVGADAAFIVDQLNRVAEPGADALLLPAAVGI